jgi:hypothetical protein
MGACQEHCPYVRRCEVLEPVDSDNQSLENFAEVDGSVAINLVCRHFTCREGLKVARTVLNNSLSLSLIKQPVIENDEQSTARPIPFGTPHKPNGRYIGQDTGKIFSRKFSDRQVYRAPGRVLVNRG